VIHHQGVQSCAWLKLLVVIHRYFVVCLVGVWQLHFEPVVCVCVCACVCVCVNMKLTRSEPAGDWGHKPRISPTLKWGWYLRHCDKNCIGKRFVFRIAGFIIQENEYQQLQWYTLKVRWVWNLMAHDDAREGKWRGNWQMEWVASTLTLPRNLMYPELLTVMRTHRLPVVDWTDEHAD